MLLLPREQTIEWSVDTPDRQTDRLDKRTHTHTHTLVVIRLKIKQQKGKEKEKKGTLFSLTFVNFSLGLAIQRNILTFSLEGRRR